MVRRHNTSSSLLVVLCCFYVHLYTALCQKSQQVRVIRQKETINQIVLGCRSSGFGDSPMSTFRFFDDLDDMSNLEVTSSGYMFNVTSNTEVIVTCQAEGDDEPSDPAYILAAPLPIENNNRRVLARKGETVLLECPFPLGNLKDSVSPYEHRWLSQPGRGIEGNSPNISVSVTNSTPSRYECFLWMRLCFGFSNCPMEEQPTESEDHVKYAMTFVDPISDVSGPDIQNVTKDSEARFECSAKGKNLEIIWNFNGTNYTRVNNMCSGDMMNVCVEHSSLTPESTQVESTLRVKANMEMNQSDVTCIVRQSFDGSIPGFNNSDFMIGVTENYSEPLSASLIVNPLPPTTEPPVTTAPTPTTAAISPGDETPVLYSAVIVSVVVIPLAIVIIIIVVLYFCHVHYRGKRNPGPIGRVLSRAFTRSSSSRGGPRHTPDFPHGQNSDELDPALFRACPSLDRQEGIDNSHTNHAVHSNGTGPQTNQDPNLQEQIYNTSQHSGYSGLSGVSNQQPGVVYKMPPYESGTDVSGASLTNDGQVNGGHLAPPNHGCNGSSRSRKSSDDSNKAYHSHHSSGGSLHNGNGLPVHYLSDRFPIEHTQLQYPENRGKAVSCHHIPGYPSYQYNAPQVPGPMFVQGNPNLYQNPRYHSDTGIVTQSHPQLYNTAHSNVQVSPYHFYNNGLPVNPPIGTIHQVPLAKESVVVTEIVVKQVMDSLMHNRNCRIPNCPCYTVRKRYSHMFKAPEPVATQSSSGSESDATIERRMKLRLPLASDDATGLNHPHYHITKDTRPKRVHPKVKLEKRRSKSVDLTPVIECSETPLKTPRVGGTLLAETPVVGNPTRTLADAANRTSSPCYQFDPNCHTDTLQPQRSISADNLPTLCLNDCPFTPSPMKENRSLKVRPPVKRLTSISAVGKPDLSTIGEKKNEGDTDASNTSSRSDSLSEPVKSSLSDNDEAIEIDSFRGNSVNDSITSTGRDVGLVHWKTIQDGGGMVTREFSQGYQSMTSEGTENSLSLKRRFEPNSSPTSTMSERDRSHRSNSPAYSTMVTLSDDGSVLHTTEC